MREIELAVNIKLAVCAYDNIIHYGPDGEQRGNQKALYPHGCAIVGWGQKAVLRTRWWRQGGEREK